MNWAQWYYGSILVSYTRGGWMAGSSPFIADLMTNIVVTEFMWNQQTLFINWVTY